MKVHMLYFKFYTDLLVPKRFGAYTVGFLIFIKTKYKNDRGLLEHEKVHVRQFWRSFGLFGIAYKLSNHYRLKYEIEAYKEQLRYSKNPEHSKDVFAEYLATKYDLPISKEYARSLL